MKKYINGIIAGIIVGIFHCLFLLFAKGLEITVFISTFITWIVVGVLISSVDFKTNSIIKGVTVSLLVSLPSLVYTFTSTIFGGIWTLFTTVLVGAFMGYIIDKRNKR